MTQLSELTYGNCLKIINKAINNNNTPCANNTKFVIISQDDIKVSERECEDILKKLKIHYFNNVDSFLNFEIKNNQILAEILDLTRPLCEESKNLEDINKIQNLKLDYEKTIRQIYEKFIIKIQKNDYNGLNLNQYPYNCNYLAYDISKELNKIGYSIKMNLALDYYIDIK